MWILWMHVRGNVWIMDDRNKIQYLEEEYGSQGKSVDDRSKIWMLKGQGKSADDEGKLWMTVGK